MKSVAVITPATSNVQLLDAIEGVATQTYPNVCHHVVCNGAKHWQAVMSRNLPQSDKLKINLIADDTAMPDHPDKHPQAHSYYTSHRIYAGCSHLVNSDYIAFLDEDNWYTPDHIASLVETIEAADLDFAYALRELYTQDKKFVSYDDFESLGKWKSMYKIYHAHSEPSMKLASLIDTSCYVFKREFLVNVAHLWHYGYAGDLRFSDMLINQSDAKFETTGLYTLCYRLNSVHNPGRIPSVHRGNALQRHKYPKGFPWEKPNAKDPKKAEHADKEAQLELAKFIKAQQRAQAAAQAQAQAKKAESDGAPTELPRGFFS